MRLAIIQDSPVYNDLKMTIDKTVDAIERAGREQCELIVFGETWLSGYPAWLDIGTDTALWDHAPVKDIWVNMYKNAIDLEEGRLKPIQTALKKHQMYAVIGINEVVTKGIGNGTIYNAILTFDANGVIVNHHRKLMPTYTEKLVHGMGDGHGLNVVQTPFGRIGSLICWEHWMPLARQAMHEGAEDVHIALWPFVKGSHQIASRHYAFEGRCYVVAVGQILQASELPPSIQVTPGIKPFDLVLRGGSAVYGPDGAVVLEPVYDKHAHLYVNIDIDRNIGEKMNLAVSGHYNRPDVFNFKVNKQRY